jgi:ligand-binding sensor domain-containing protein
LTPANKAVAFLTVLLLACAARAQKATSELTSNDIWSLSARGDSLMILTADGINFSSDVSGDTIQWTGFLDLRAWEAAWGGATALALMLPEHETERINSVWLYNLAGGAQKVIDLDYPAARNFGNDTTHVPANFYAADACWHDNAYWIACNDGGLVRLDEDGGDAVAFVPGIDKAAYAPSAFPPDTIESFPDSAIAVVAATADDSGYVWICTREGVMLFNPQDSVWQPIDVSSVENPRFFDLAIAGGGDSAIAYIAASAGADTSLYRYDNASATLTEALETPPLLTVIGAHVHACIAPAADRRLYVATNDGTGLYRDTNGELTREISSTEFQKRILEGYDRDRAGIGIQDLGYSSAPSDTFFYLATSEGLFYSPDAHRDERKQRAFRYQFRSLVIDGGLKEVYAYPSIINQITDKAWFAYNLSENARVTIDIYDYAMDHVTRIIDNQPRRAGSNLPRGRSTEQSADYWDGTFRNNGGKTVAPGPYYFKIATDKGQRAFGKVIVAKPR